MDTCIGHTHCHKGAVELAVHEHREEILTIAQEGDPLQTLYLLVPCSQISQHPHLSDLSVRGSEFGTLVEQPKCTKALYVCEIGVCGQEWQQESSHEAVAVVYRLVRRRRRTTSGREGWVTVASCTAGRFTEELRSWSVGGPEGPECGRA